MVMRSLEDLRSRWQRTINCATSLPELKLATRLPGDESPCISGLRSVCWKVFLLFQGTDLSIWATLNKDSRDLYKSLRGQFLKYIENPEEIGSLLDPLADDKNSPWTTLRQDEELRAEILQDVERCMPDEQYFRLPETQQMLLDILFIFCKLNQDVGYRQGMHELLAPILWVVELDAIDAIGKENIDPAADHLMLDTLDSRYIEHDAFTIFSLLMQSAKSFYEIGMPDKRSSSSHVASNPQNGASPIVERSKRIHEMYLARVDPDLASHLTAVEVLPQIFLIRWIRLMFGREFPFDSLLALWDTLFAEDPALDLIDMICVAMLLRIRWQLIEADYSIALTLLLKYPALEPPHGPQTLVEDGLYLKKNFNQSGGAHIITKYSGRTPAPVASSSRPLTPAGRTLSPDSKVSRRVSPLPSAARYLQQQGGVEALLQGAAKTVFERGERLGINKAVRDAVGEVKRNLQGVSSSGASRNSDTYGRWSLDEERLIPGPRKTMISIEQRNKQLASMLQEALDELRKVQLATPDANGESNFAETIDLAIAKVQFVQVYLEDSGMPLPPEFRNTDTNPSSPAAPKVFTPEPSIQQLSNDQGSPEVLVTHIKSPRQIAGSELDSPAPQSSLDLDSSEVALITTNTPDSSALLSETPAQSFNTPERPRAPVPTRSSLAQSSFAWMLEPDEPPTSTATSSSPKLNAPFLPSGKSTRIGPNREKTAFLFGDDADDVLDPVSVPKSKKNSMQEDPETDFVLGTMRGKKAA